MKADNTWQGAKVFADYCRDNNDDVLANHWDTIGVIQFNAMLLWAKYGAAWGLTELRRLPDFARTRGKMFQVNGQGYMMEMVFARHAIGVTLFKEDPNGEWKTRSDGMKHSIVGDTTFRRDTLDKHGVDDCLRTVVLRLLKSAEKVGVPT